LPKAKSLPEPVIAPIRRDKTVTGLALSVLLHAAVIGAFYVTIPFWRRPEIVPSPLIVDLVPIDEITAAPPPKVEEQKEPEPAPEPPAPEETAPPKDEPMPPEPQPQPEPEPKPEPPKPQPPRIPPPPPKPQPPKPKKNDMAQLQELLKNLQKKKPAESAPPSASDAESRNQTAAVSTRATMTELDAIRHHFESCWRIDPGQEGLENLSAEIRVVIGADGSVKQAVILDTARYFTDSKFKTFANNARIAVLGCSGVPITPENYEQLKEMTLNFSPQGRIN
jgi:outer membrane biosynthesis protein TonB